ncbi:SAM-dependent methyltransferase [Amycolatopsis alkalitolerans]|uniref:SAM-dependent methyltransferase n=1 Tax=Amycolatopsis alkalitolerans TaxID=2547244 RepID=UPI0022861AA9|nr:SAM-dependent methyltransferase [Amycolatopsis alkalitolerans]
MRSRRISRSAIRDPDEVAAFFTGLKLVEPGLVPLPDWRPEDPDYVPDEEDAPRRVSLCGVAALGR